MSKGTSNDQRTQTAAEWLVRLSSSTPAEADLIAWRQWLDEDSANRLVFEDLQRLWASTKRVPPSAETLALLLDPEEKGADKPLEPPQERGWVQALKERAIAPRYVAALVASTVFAIAVTIFTIRLQGNSAQVESLTTQVGQDDTVLLQDGSRVDLGGRSAVEVKYTRSRRHLEMLSGEAYFQDRDYAKWPFVVSAGNLQVRAIGTAFDVEKDENQAAVSVVRGLVEVSLSGHRIGSSASDMVDPRAANGPTLLVRPGEKVVIHSDGSMHEYTIDPAEAIAWRQGRLEFTDVNLKEVIEAVNRYAARPIVIASPTVGAMRFTGTVFVRATGEWVHSLPAVFPLIVDASDPKALVLRPKSP